MFLLILVVGLGDLVRIIPMPALVAVMIMVSIGTFDWGSLRSLVTHPRRSSVVMLATVVIVVWTHNLALGVFAGVLLSGLFFASKIAQIFRVTSTLSPDGTERRYVVEGQVFFASAGQFVDAIDFRESVPRVVIDVSRAHIWDLTGVGALDKAVLRFRKAGVAVEVVGLNEASRTIVDKLTVQNRADALELEPGH